MVLALMPIRSNTASTGAAQSARTKTLQPVCEATASRQNLLAIVAIFNPSISSISRHKGGDGGKACGALPTLPTVAPERRQLVAFGTSGWEAIAKRCSLLRITAIKHVEREQCLIDLPPDRRFG